MIGTLLKFEDVAKFFPNNIFTYETQLTDKLITLTQVHGYSSNRNKLLIPVGVFTDQLYFDRDETLWSSNISIVEVKKLIDELFSIDSKITYITIYE